MSRQFLNQLLKDLKPRSHADFPICLRVEHELVKLGVSVSKYHTVIGLLDSLIAQWPESLDKQGNYPVEGSFEEHVVSWDIRWNPYTEFGKRRIQLLNWLVQQTS